MSRNTTRSDCTNVFQKLRVSFINDLSKPNTIFACTSDLWIGYTKTSFICVTVYYVDKDWTSQKRLLGFR